MTNAEKFKSVEERAKEFCVFCDAHKRSFCFYCKHQSVEIVEHGNGYMARCACCDYQSRTYDSKEEAYSAHNRVAKAVKESEVKHETN